MRQVCWGTFWVASRVSSTVSYFKKERGISLEMLQWEWASFHDDGEPFWFSRVAAGFSSYDVEFTKPLLLPPGKSNLHSSCEGELRIALESLKGK